MCGFAGFCSNTENKFENAKEIAQSMALRIRHRGPDSEGVYSDERYSVGFCRLKIIDPHGGDQPMTDKSGRYVITFNGEIYNYKSLRETLISDFSVSFNTQSDTEVLLQACINYGRDVLRHLRGMYSFAFYDKEEKRLFCARDPFGIKPFYYGIFDDTLIFSSEIKAFYAHPSFKAEFNSDVLPLYLQFQYVPTEDTAFSGVRRLLPGHFLEYDCKKLQVHKFFNMPTSENGKFSSYSFFSSPVSKQEHVSSLKNEAKILDEVLSESVKMHLEADVEVGMFLSGGVDSALIASLAKPDRAFTVGFGESEFDERSEAKETAEKLGVKLTQRQISASAFFRAMPMVQYHSDEPCANLSAVPLFLLAETASRDVKTVLSGEGADELFAGYDLYNPSFYGKIYRKLPKKLRASGKKMSFLGKRMTDFAKRNAQSVEDAFIGQAKIMSASTAFSILSPKYQQLRASSEITLPYYKNIKGASELQKMLYLDRHLWLPFDILNKADKMTMAHSLELRVPYLDLKVLSIAQTMSDKLLIHGKQGKYVLRATAKKHLGSKAALRPKKGFPVPFRSWIKSPEYFSLLQNAFSSPTCDKFFDSDKLKALLSSHVSGCENNARVLYTVYSFIVWYDIYFGSSSPKFFTTHIGESENDFAPNSDFLRDGLPS